MKRILAALIFAFSAVAMTSCQSETKYGDCVGLDDYADRDPNLRYDVSAQNVIVGLVFFQMFFVPPVVVALDEFYCPTGRIAPVEK